MPALPPVRPDAGPPQSSRTGRRRLPLRPMSPLVFNAFTGTILHGTRRRPRELILIVCGFAQGVPTAQLARELDCDRAELLKLRHRLQEAAYRNRDIMPLETGCWRPTRPTRGKEPQEVQDGLE